MSSEGTATARHPWRLAIPVVMVLAGCQFTAFFSGSAGSPSSQVDEETSKGEAKPDRFKFFIRGKKTSNLSEDRRSLTLSIDAADPDGGELKIEWSQDKEFGTFSSTRGKDVQWSVSREGNYTVTITVTVRGSVKTDDPDVAVFVIPVVDGKIKATEIPPEITVAPQSVALFRSLPSSLALTNDKLAELGVKTRTQLTATSYTYDPASNAKIKQSGDFSEIKWSSDDPAIVVVDDNGYIRPADGSATGTTLVTASSKTNSGSRAATQVSVQYLDTKITLSYPTTTIFLSGQGSPNSVTVGAQVQYSNPLDRSRIIFTDPNGRELTWSSSNPGLAQVDASGRVTPLADASPGQVTITGTSNYDPSKSASVTIQVKGSSSSAVSFVAR